MEDGELDEEFEDPNRESMCSERNCCTPRGRMLFCRRMSCVRPSVKLRKIDARHLKTVTLDLPLPPLDTGRQLRPDNTVITSKYTIWTFVPAATALQFRRAVNVFYLFQIVLLVIGYYFPSLFLSPFSPWGTFMILCFVIGVTLIFEGRDDIQRHHTDAVANSTRVSVVAAETGKRTKTTWGSIRPGTLVVLHNREMVPADVVVIETSDPGARVYIETSGIDGETNLKIRQASVEMKRYVRGSGAPSASSDDGEDLRTPATIEKAAMKVQGTLEYEEPNAFLQFSGKFTPSDRNVSAVPIGFDSVLLRGSEIRNTKWVLAVVVYAGHETKLILSKKNTPSKFSTLDILTNNLMYVTMFELLVMDVVAVVILVLLTPNTDQIWYFDYTDSLNVFLLPGWLAYFLTFSILLSNVVPIDLYVCLEVASFVQGFFINNDRKMYDEESDTRAQTRTGNLISEIGQVTHIFSDKTGTLTQNVMSLVGISVAGKRYGISDAMKESTPQVEGELSTSIVQLQLEKPISDMPGKDDPDGRVRWYFKEMLDDFKKGASSRVGERVLRKVEEFLVLLAVCHTVVIDEDDNGKPRYNAEGPDEEALVKAAAALGVRLLSTGDEGYVIENERAGGRVTYQVLAIIGFTSARKRMTAIVRRKGGSGSSITLLMKGADNIIAKRLSKEYMTESATNEKYLEWKALDKDLNYFAESGLRTLVMCSKNISEEDYREWAAKWQEAKVTAGSQREDALEEAANLIERDCELLGASAIEDALQEGVPETIEILRQAGINVWVLTGDKVETAINIGFASNLLDKNMFQIILDDENPASLLETIDKYHQALTHLAKEAPRAMYGGQEITVNVQGINDPTPTPADDNGGIEKLWDSQQELALIVTGKALELLLSKQKGDKNSEAKFVSLARSCSAVVACRVSPSQKALVVRAVVDGSGNSRLKKPISLSIGDGANDVAMIQEARIGVGISGKEGRQAVNNSDFSIAQFRFLKRLLLVHGRWNYRRNAQMTIYICYAFQTMNFLLFGYLFLSMVSGQQVYTDTYYVTFFSWFTGPMAMGFAWFDKDISIETALRYPMSYVTGRDNWDLNGFSLFKMFVRSAIHAAVCWTAIFYVTLPLQNNDIGVLGASAYLTVTWTCLLYQFMVGRTWTWLMLLGVVVLLVAFPIAVTVLDNIYQGISLIFTQAVGVCWFSLFWSLASMIVLEHTFFGFKALFYPHSMDILIEADALPAYRVTDALGAAAQGRRILIPVEKIRAAMHKQFATKPSAMTQRHPSGFVYEGVT